MASEEGRTSLRGSGRVRWGVYEGGNAEFVRLCKLLADWRGAGERASFSPFVGPLLRTPLMDIFGLAFSVPTTDHPTPTLDRLVSAWTRVTLHRLLSSRPLLLPENTESGLPCIQPTFRCALSDRKQLYRLRLLRTQSLSVQVGYPL
jgi:hypothetical protein